MSIIPSLYKKIFKCVVIEVEKILYSVPVAQWLEHCVSSAKVVGSIPREHTY